MHAGLIYVHVYLQNNLLGIFIQSVVSSMVSESLIKSTRRRIKNLVQWINWPPDIELWPLSIALTSKTFHWAYLY